MIDVATLAQHPEMLFEGFSSWVMNEKIDLRTAGEP